MGKIILSVAAVVGLTVGGFFYYQHTSADCETCPTNTVATDASLDGEKSCCSGGSCCDSTLTSTDSCSGGSCCASTTDTATKSSCCAGGSCCDSKTVTTAKKDGCCAGGSCCDSKTVTTAKKDSCCAGGCSSTKATDTVAKTSCSGSCSGVTPQADSVFVIDANGKMTQEQE